MSRSSHVDVAAVVLFLLIIICYVHKTRVVLSTHFCLTVS